MVSPVVIAGPTASSKSEYALRLAEQIQGEIVCADSRQVYVGMRIGTAGPKDAELRRVPHHGFNVIDPKEVFDAGKFVEATDRYVAEIATRKKTPIIVGGTGLYLRAWRYGLTDVPSEDRELRGRLKSEAATLGIHSLYDELKAVDPESAKKIAPADSVRILRAVEIWRRTSEPPSKLRRSFEDAPPRVVARWILIWPEPEWHLTRIKARAEEMFEEGLIKEAKALRQNLGEGHPLLDTMGYREALNCARGECTLEEAVNATFVRQRQYAKRQKTWFKKETFWERVTPR